MMTLKSYISFWWQSECAVPLLIEVSKYCTWNIIMLSCYSLQCDIFLSHGCFRYYFIFRKISERSHAFLWLFSFRVRYIEGTCLYLVGSWALALQYFGWKGSNLLANTWIHDITFNEEIVRWPIRNFVQCIKTMKKSVLNIKDPFNRRNQTSR